MSFKPIKKKPLKVILYANALFVPFQFRIDIFNELERLLKRNFDLILLSAVKRELELLAMKGTSKMRKDARCAMKFASNLRFVDVDFPSSALTDDVIVETAREWSAVVFTNDKLLRRRLRDISVPVVYVRQNSRLDIDGIV